MVGLNVVVDQHQHCVASQAQAHLLGIPWELHDEVRDVAQHTGYQENENFDVKQECALNKASFLEELKKVTRIRLV